MKAGKADGRQMSRAARPCDSFNQSLGCVPLGPEANYARSCYEASQPRYTASCQTLAKRYRVTYGRTFGFPSRNFPFRPSAMLSTFVSQRELHKKKKREQNHKFPTLQSSPISICFVEIFLAIIALIFLNFDSEINKFSINR